MRALIRQRANRAFRDPAPSRVAYRLHRLWLTPLYRALLFKGLPAFALILGAGVWFNLPERAQALVQLASDLRTQLEERPEFQVSELSIMDASQELSEDIREVLGLDLPISSFRLDLPEMRALLEGLDPVARAELVVRTGGILEIRIEERVPAIVWRSGAGLELLDIAGHRVAALPGRALRPDLHLIAGDGAGAHVPEALAIFARAAPLAGRVRGLVRVGERRWDIVLDRGQRVLLPETGALAAVDQLIVLDRAHDLLERDIGVIDLRDRARPTLQLREPAVEQLREKRMTQPGKAGEDA